MEALNQALTFGFVSLFVIQCLIGFWAWKLASDGRRIRRETARIKAQDSLIIEKLWARRGDKVLDESAKALEAVAAQRSTRSFKLGIALSGGGGKGAYQVGVLRGLRAAGVRPDVIAGTSVGAINATLLCLDKVEVAADFWSTISFWQVAKVSVANLIAIPLLLFAFVTAGSSDDIDGPMRRLILLRYYAFLVPFNIIGVLFMGWPWLAVATNVLGCAVVVSMGYLADSLVGLLGLALLNNAPLATNIQANAASRAIRAAPILVYVTVAARRRIIDPNYPHWLDLRKRGLMGRQPYVPEYRCLQEESDADVHRLVLQSAAIPFGVFPLRRIGRSGYVDGGVADNVPIQPLIDAGCTSIVVIHLDPNGDCDGWRLTNEDDLWARAGQLRELRRLATLGLKQPVENITKQARLRDASPDLLLQDKSAHVRMDYMRANVTFVHIVPSESLGNFFTGTMNFSAKNARRLINLGEHDARIVLSRYPKFAARTASHASAITFGDPA